MWTTSTGVCDGYPVPKSKSSSRVPRFSDSWDFGIVFRFLVDGRKGGVGDKDVKSSKTQILRHWLAVVVLLAL